VLIFAVVGGAVAVATQREPGAIIGGFVFVGTIAAGLVVETRAVHVIIPVPALAYLVTAPIAGIIHDQAATTSRTALVTSAAQWFADGFLAMVIATAMAIAITAARRTRASHRAGRGASRGTSNGAGRSAGHRSGERPRGEAASTARDSRRNEPPFSAGQA
jgi:hypothetical protein